jgi:hypothetical protein
VSGGSSLPFCYPAKSMTIKTTSVVAVVSLWAALINSQNSCLNMPLIAWYFLYCGIKAGNLYSSLTKVVNKGQRIFWSSV